MSSVSFRTMTIDEFNQFKEWEINDYARNMFKEGQFTSIEEAMKESEDDFSEGLPNDLDTPDNYLLIIENAEKEKVGILWYETTNRKRDFIEDIIIKQEYRHKGYGLQTLKNLESELVEKGIYRIVLHVFESNVIARKLYEKAGFTYLKVDEDEPGSLYMVKELQFNVGLFEGRPTAARFRLVGTKKMQCY